MKIRIKLFAFLSDYLPSGARNNEADLDVAGDATISDVIAEMKLPTERCHLVLVNGVYVGPSARADHVLRSGDALAIWPPVAGG